MKLIRWKEVKEKLGGESGPSKVTLWRWEKKGLFPKRVKIGLNSNAWIESEVDNFIRERAADR